MEQAQEELARETQEMNARNEELKELEELHKTKSGQIVEYNLEIQKITHELEKHNREHHGSRQVIRDLENANDWIADQKQYVTRQAHGIVVLMHS